MLTILCCSARVYGTASGHRCLALRDCWDWWNANGEVGHAGKPLLLNPGDRSTHEIFFDDNVLADRIKIVDARDAATGDVLPFEDVRDVYVVRVDPVQVLLSPTYYLDRIAAAEAKR